jgi:hypothetical protein
MIRKQLVAAVALLALTAPALAAAYTAILTGDQAVPATNSMATGEATFRPDKKDAKIRFKVTVQNLYDVMEAHLYMGDAGTPALPEMVVATLYPGPMIPGKAKKVLCSGALGAGDLTGPLVGHGFDELVRALELEQLFVNVITEPHLEGEIRGQVH